MKRLLTLFLFSLFLMSATESSVYICASKNAYTYHNKRKCNGLNRCSKEIKKVTVPEAKRAGYRACKICYK